MLACRRTMIPLRRHGRERVHSIRRRGDANRSERGVDNKCDREIVRQYGLCGIRSTRGTAREQTLLLGAERVVRGGRILSDPIVLTLFEIKRCYFTNAINEPMNRANQ